MDVLAAFSEIVHQIRSEPNDPKPTHTPNSFIPKTIQKLTTRFKTHFLETP